MSGSGFLVISCGWLRRWNGNQEYGIVRGVSCRELIVLFASVGRAGCRFGGRLLVPGVAVGVAVARWRGGVDGMGMETGNAGTTGAGGRTLSGPRDVDRASEYG